MILRTFGYSIRLGTIYRVTGTNDMYSVLVQPMDSMEYYRITTNGVCKDTVFASVNVIDPPDLTVSPDTSFLCLGSLCSYQPWPLALIA
ncbi:MAG: hypothetical protein R2778_14260 [Saprospiraceae bacterium]